MNIARVFPRRTNATPTDALAFAPARGAAFVQPPLPFMPISEVHISVAFEWDLPLAHAIAEVWAHIAPVRIGGPALNEPGSEFVPGRYLKPGYVITSRGCPNRCWFCCVPRREGGTIRELPITDGWNVLDDNLLACSEQHIREVFKMLTRHPYCAEFTGGLEAARLQDWHVHLLRLIHTRQMFFAYDTPDDYEPLRRAGEMLIDAGFTRASHALRCFVLIGHPRDTFEDAEQRLRQTIDAGFFPMAMLWRDRTGKVDPLWRRFQRTWARPQIVAKEMSV